MLPNHAIDSDASQAPLQYKVNVESQRGGQTSNELLVARRIGDC